MWKRVKPEVAFCSGEEERRQHVFCCSTCENSS